jgi:hypothetical protein
VQNLFENEPWVEITAHVTDEARMEEAKAQIAAHLRLRHGIEQGSDGQWLDDFRLTTKKDILRDWSCHTPPQLLSCLRLSHS